MTTFRVFIVDDEKTIREGLCLALTQTYQVAAFSNAEDALAAMADQAPDLVLLDIGLPGMDGIAALKKMKHLDPRILVIMITAYEDINSVVSTMKSGAYDYVVKPINMDGLEATIRNALETIRLRKEVETLQNRLLEENLPCFIGESNGIKGVLEFLEVVAKSPDTPIMIIGETGTGKELIARAIHYRSPNFNGPLITVNCAAIPRDLIESELFGYEKGAFSGARESGKTGLVEAAENGTLFLDEIGDLALEAQSKLLRFLESGEFLKVGGTRMKTIRTRILSATNKDIAALIEKDRFRKDLFFRLSVIKMQVPSLNARREDIMPLAKHFLIHFRKKFSKKIMAITPDARQALMDFNWVGNVRELKSVIERGVLVGNGPELTVEDLGMEELKLPANGRLPADPFSFPDMPPAGIDLPAVEAALATFYIEQALERTDGNESQAARLLNINHHTFRYRRKKIRKKPAPGTA